MDQVTVEVRQLLDRVRENKEAHDLIYQAAVAGYWETAQEELEKKLEQVARREVPSNVLNIQYPVSHAEDYETAIVMLEMSVQDQVTLDQRSFAQLVLNKWNWTQAFLQVNTLYAMKGAQGPAGDRGLQGASPAVQKQIDAALGKFR